jgi:hypothetical protein
VIRQWSKWFLLRLVAAVFAAALVTAASGAAARGYPPEMLPPGDPVWDDLWRLEVAGALPAGITGMRPVPRGEVASWIAAALREGKGDPITLARLRRSFARELSRAGAAIDERETVPFIDLVGGDETELRLGPAVSFQARGGDGRARLGDSTRVGVRGAFLASDRLALQGEIFVGRIENGREIGDPLINHTDVLYFSEDAGLTARSGVLRLRLARSRHHWGGGPPEGGSLLLDARAQPINHFQWDIDLPAGIRFESWSGTLNAFEERGIAGHRLEVPLGRDLRISVAEGVRFRGGMGNPLYLLGALPYTLVQRLDEQDTRDVALRKTQRNNVLADAEIMWRPRPGSALYGEFLVDDLPAASAHNPARGGIRLGVTMTPLIAGGPVEIDLEGTKIGRYVYAVAYDDSCECNWIHQGIAIGSPDGPDQESVRLTIGRGFGRDHRIQAAILYANRGAGRLGESWNGTTGTTGTREAFRVSSPVERERRLALAWRWDPRDNVHVESGVAGSFVRDPGNRPVGLSARGYRSRFLVSVLAAWRL